MTRSPKSLALRSALLLACLTPLACVTPRVLAGAAARVSPEVRYFFPTEELVVALTIDDGPDPSGTPAILEVLERHEARATFFLVGSRVPGNEALLARMRAESHEVANHTLHERASVLVGSEELSHELEETHALLAPYGDVRWFRPGSGFYSSGLLDVASAQGYRTALGDVFPLDPLIPSSSFHAWYILRNVRPGSIIVLHDANGRGARTAATLEVVIPALRERGYRVVTLSDLEAVSTRASR